MANPAKQTDPYDDDSAGQPVTRPNLRALEGGGEGGKSPRGDSGPRAVPNTPADQGNLYNPSGSGKGGSDSSTGSGKDGLYNSASETSKKGRLRRALNARNRKRAAIGGTMTGAIIAGIFGVLTIASGPMEFIHIAQNLERFHFGAQEDAQDSRLTRIARYIHNPSRPQDARLGLVGNAVANKLETKMNKATGLKPDFDPKTGKNLGYTTNPEHEKFKGSSEAQIKEHLATQYGIDKSTIKVERVNGKLVGSFNPDPGGKNLLKRYRAQTAFSRQLLGISGLNRVAAYTGTRVLGARAGWTFHPVKKLDQKIIETVAKGGQKAKDAAKKKAKDTFIKNNQNLELKGASPARPGGEASTKGTPGPDGNPSPENASREAAIKDGVDTAKQEAEKLDPTNDKSKENFKKSVATKAGGGAAGVLGLACVVRNVSANIDKERQAKVVLPQMRKASKIISLGSQIQSNQDIDPLSLEFMKDFLYQKDENGKIVSSYTDSKSWQAETGAKQTGPDVKKSSRVYTQGNAFDFLDNIPALGEACGVLGGVAGQVFGILTGPVNYVVSGFVMEQAVDFLSDWLSGEPVSPISAGAEYGNDINYGSRASFNDQSAFTGGVQLSAAEESVTKTNHAFLDNKDFATKSIAYRMFNTRDSRTLASRVIDENASGNMSQSFAKMTHNFGSLFASALRMPATLLTGITHAKESESFDYSGMKKVGFSADELADPAFDNPFDNTCYVVGNCKLSDRTVIGAGILSGPNGQTYIDRAKACFGVNISNDGAVWASDGKTVSVDFASSSYPTEDCKDKALEWLRVRFWLLDTATIEGYDCNQSDSATAAQSCADLGFGGTADDQAGVVNNDSSAAASTDDVADNVKALAQQMLDLARQGKFTMLYDAFGKDSADRSNPKDELEDLAAGKKANTTQKRICSGGTNARNATTSVDPKLLQFLVALAQSGVKYNINALAGQCHSATSNHYKGVAVDFACGLNTGKADTVGKKYGVSRYSGETCANAAHWHYSTTGD